MLSRCCLAEAIVIEGEYPYYVCNKCSCECDLKDNHHAEMGNYLTDFHI